MRSALSAADEARDSVRQLDDTTAERAGLRPYAFGAGGVFDHLDFGAGGDYFELSEKRGWVTVYVNSSTGQYTQAVVDLPDQRIFDSAQELRSALTVDDFLFARPTTDTIIYRISDARTLDARHLDAPDELAMEASQRLRRVFDRYACDAREVAPFINTHPALPRLLLDAVQPIQDLFGREVALSLSLARDPDAPSEPQLYAGIATSLPTGEATALLDSFDERWFLDRLSEAAGRLNFTLELV